VIPREKLGVIVKRLLVGAALVALLASPAMAADLPVKAKAPPPAPVYTWTGCYVGFNVGGAYGKSGIAYQNINPYSSLGPGVPFVAGTNEFTFANSIGGAQAGCNYQFSNRVVVGIEGSYFRTAIDETNANILQVFAPANVQTVTTTINSIYSVAGRLGYAFYPDWLGYVKGGYASARIETSGITNPPIVGLILNWNTSRWHSGHVAGAGLEYRAAKNIVVGIEYDYFGLDTNTHIGAVSGGAIGPANQIVHSVSANVQSVTARVSFLFGPNAAIVAKY
jgi:outer membrane immunogenic protein